MKVVIYHKPEKNTTKSENDLILAELISFCKGRNFEVLNTYLEDIQTDGRQKPVFTQLIKDANRRKFEAVIVWSFKNFRRFSGMKDAKYILHLTSLGIMFISYKEPFFDTTGSHANILMPMLDWLAEEEANSISERTKAGIEKAKRQGTVFGRPKLDIDVERAIQLREEGKSFREIAKIFRTSKETIRRLILESKPNKDSGELNEEASDL